MYESVTQALAHKAWEEDLCPWISQPSFSLTERGQGTCGQFKKTKSKVAATVKGVGGGQDHLGGGGRGSSLGRSQPRWKYQDKGTGQNQY